MAKLRLVSHQIVSVTGRRLPTTDIRSQFIKAVSDVTQWSTGERSELKISGKRAEMRACSIISNEDRCMVASFICRPLT